MDTIKSYLLDFVEGRVSVPQFILYCEEHPEVLDWLTSVGSAGFQTHIIHKEIDDNGYCTLRTEAIPFDAKMELYNIQNNSFSSTLSKHLDIHDLFSRVLLKAFPDEQIVVDSTLSDTHCFMLDACPEYIGGPEAEMLLEKLLNDLPKELSKSKQIKHFKDQIRELFHIEKNKYPRWIQGADWPISPSGKPMRFVEQKRKKGKEYETMLYTLYVFEDVDTGEQRTIEQFT